MAGSGDKAADAALWRRWRLEPRPETGGEEPDSLVLAAYAEGRLGEAEQEIIEAWLADHPEMLDDVLASRAAAETPLPAASERVTARATALVAAPSQDGATVVPFQPRRPQSRPAWRTAAAWGGLAASLLLTSMVGFGIGDNAYLSLVRQPTAFESVAHELWDPPSALFDPVEEPTT